MKKKRVLALSNTGFSLVELSMVVIVSGLLLSGAAAVYANFKRQADENVTINHIEESDRVLREFYGLKGRYPCPADPTLPETDPDFGEELCRDPAWIAAGGPVFTCHPGIPCGNEDSRDTDDDGVDDVVLIGALPFKTLFDSKMFAEFITADGFDFEGNQFTYAVSERMTRGSVLAPANSSWGAITLEDGNGTSIVEPDSSAHYVIVSHGRKRVGAYSKQGMLTDPCFVGVMIAPPAPTATTGAGGLPLELENCDRNDALFIREEMSLGESGDSYFDDIVYYNANVSISPWAQTFVGTKILMYNTNVGNVAVGDDYKNPDEKLDIERRLRVDGDVNADEGFCHPNQASVLAAECIKPDALVTTCPEDKVATGIVNGALVCGADIPTPNAAEGDWACPEFPPASNRFVQGITIDKDGRVTCVFN